MAANAPRMTQAERTDLSDRLMLDSAVKLIVERGVERTTAPCPRTLQGPYGTEPHHAATGAKRGLENRTTAKPHRLPRRSLPHKLRLPLVAKHCGQARPAGSVPQTAIQHM